MGSRCPSCQQRRWELPQLAADRQARSCDRGDALTTRANRAWWHRPSSPPTGRCRRWSASAQSRTRRPSSSTGPRRTAESGSVAVLVRRRSDEGFLRRAFPGAQRLHRDLLVWNPRPGVSYGTYHGREGACVRHSDPPAAVCQEHAGSAGCGGPGRGRRRWPVTAACSTSASHGHVRI
jgi:hypothetical protein